jgi:phage gpG-like protein
MAKKVIDRAAINRIKKQVPEIAATLAVNWFKDSFRRQGFTDTGFRKWQKRKPGAKRNRGRAILVDTGRLRRSIRKKKVTYRQTVIGTSVPYAAFHNEGIKPQPQRQFIGESEKLNRKTIKLIYKTIDKALGF